MNEPKMSKLFGILLHFALLSTSIDVTLFRHLEITVKVFLLLQYPLRAVFRSQLHALSFYYPED